MSELYDFKKLKEYLTSLGYQVGDANPFTPYMEDLDFTQIENLEFVSISDGGGIKITGKDGRIHIGGIYKKEFYHDWKGRISDPKIHLCNCETIQKWGRDAFRHVNHVPAPYFDKSSLQERNMEVGELCGYCKQLLQQQNKDYSDFADFVGQMREQFGAVGQTDAVDVDINGYTRDWKRISDAFRKKKEFRCEKCGWQPDNDFDKRFIQVHHKSGIKVDNSESNLLCLCIECHSKMDERHRENFSTGANKIQLEAFKKLLNNEDKTK